MTENPMPNIIYIPIEIKPGGEMPEYTVKTGEHSRSDIVAVIDGHGVTHAAYYEHNKMEWFYDDNIELTVIVTHWLKPVDAEELLGKVWDAGYKRGFDMGIKNWSAYPDKQTTIQSLLNQ